MPYINIMRAKDAYDYVLKHVGANIPCRDIVDERVIEEVRTGIPYYEKKLPKDAYGDLTGLSPKSMGEDGQFKYRRLPKDSYRAGVSSLMFARWVAIPNTKVRLTVRYGRRSVCRTSGKLPTD